MWGRVPERATSFPSTYVNGGGGVGMRCSQKWFCWRPLYTLHIITECFLSHCACNSFFYLLIQLICKFNKKSFNINIDRLSSCIKRKGAADESEGLKLLLTILFLSKTWSIDWEDLSSTQDSVWPQTPRSLPKILHYVSYFQLSSRCLEMWSTTIFYVWYITSCSFHDILHEQHSLNFSAFSWHQFVYILVKCPHHPCDWRIYQNNVIPFAQVRYKIIKTLGATLMPGLLHNVYHEGSWKNGQITEHFKHYSLFWNEVTAEIVHYSTFCRDALNFGENCAAYLYYHSRGCLCKNSPLILPRKFHPYHKPGFRRPYLVNHIFLEHQQYVLFFQFWQARNLCQADQTSINPRKIQSKFLIK